jgi:hypothetical protein
VRQGSGGVSPPAKEKMSEPAIGKLDKILQQYPNATIASSVPLPTAQGAARSGRGLGGQAPQRLINHPQADALAALAATAQSAAYGARQGREGVSPSPTKKKGEALPPSPFYIRPPDAKPQTQ